MDPGGSFKPASPSPPLSSLTPPLNTSTRLCLRWRCPKRRWPLFLYHLPAFSPPPPPPVSSALFQDRKGGRLRTGRPDPSWPGVFSRQRVPFLVNLFLVLSDTSATKTDICSITHVEYCEALFKGSSNNYNEEKLICWICACILKDNGDRKQKQWKNLTKKRKNNNKKKGE